MYYQVLIDTDYGTRVYASGDKEHCLKSMDLAESHGYDARLIGVPV